MKSAFATLALLATTALAQQGATPLIVAHRGASHDAPENTLAAQRLAWEQGADAVETDIHLTRDGRIIVLHDKSLKRTTGRDAPVVDVTLAEARTLDAGSWKSPRFAGEKLPTLAEQFALVPPGKRLLVEIKTGPEIVPELARMLAAAGASEATVKIISFNYDSLKAVREKLPRFPTLYLVGYDTRRLEAGTQPTLADIIAQARAAGLTGLDLQKTWPLTDPDVRAIRDAGLELHVWTVDEPDVARRWIELGAASITTNRPGWLREQLRR
ncbi:MAG TPA: glycerophosphodiester phosphodiesterase [Opitutaceae bacterium]